MDFSLPHNHEESLATLSKIRHINNNDTTTEEPEPSVEKRLMEKADKMVIDFANNAAANLFLGNWNTNNNNDDNDDGDGDDDNGENTTTNNNNNNISNNNNTTEEHYRELMNSALYPERSTPQSEKITEDSLLVVFESFDSLNFCYPQKGKIFNNRNGHFHHDDFIGKPFGCKIRSRNNQGYGFVYLLKPTPELWSRSLNHRTQIIHFLDASMIVFYLNIRPNMVVCESGTGSGALSHCIMRSIAPKGMLHTYEFNKQRAETAREEFANNGVSHISNVYHKDVCGKHGLNTGGFDRPQASVDAIILDLPEPWLAVPHAAYCIKRNSRIVSYSPCIEQAQKTIEALKKNGFHSIKTMEFRLKENYVDEVEVEMPPTEKRQRCEDLRVYPKRDKEIAAGVAVNSAAAVTSDSDNNKKQEEKNAAADQKKTETETSEAAAETIATTSNTSDLLPLSTNNNILEPPTSSDDKPSTETITSTSNATTTQLAAAGSKRKPRLVARPFVIMRGHTAFLTFATSGNTLKPKP